jgi:hypothetical protein
VRRTNPILPDIDFADIVAIRSPTKLGSPTHRRSESAFQAETENPVSCYVDGDRSGLESRYIGVEVDEDA